MLRHVNPALNFFLNKYWNRALRQARILPRVQQQSFALRSFAANAAPAPVTAAAPPEAPQPKLRTAARKPKSPPVDKRALPPLGARQFAPDTDWTRTDFPWSPQVTEAVRSVFGHERLRANQLEVINATLAGYDTFVLMPTGGGKSLCFQVPAVVSKGVTVVVSPLLSLMQDQGASLDVRGVEVRSLGSDQGVVATRKVFQALLDPPETAVKLLYVTPEKIGLNEQLVEALRRLHSTGQLARIVIDEAHCISHWGHEFRPQYRNLLKLRKEFPEVPVMACTATAATVTQNDVVEQLGVHPLFFQQSFNRPNLRYSVEPKAVSASKDVIPWIKQHYPKECGIVYCLSRADCEKLADELLCAGISAAFYHAGMAKADRKEAQQRWHAGQVRVIVATIAFGMGIDKPNVRFVVHHSMARSLEGYCQETGRAGRDGQSAECVLFYKKEDLGRLYFMLKQSAVNPTNSARAFRGLEKMVAYCESDTECRRVMLLQHLGENATRELCAGTCDNCEGDKAWFED
eukprot:TRINITY_DN821_c0_g1_i1.p1 TRINITY_DN821_c0_g1~~TRINITY_DN821_c0_g1_i1.p1  ORF type:complete len:517 (-),score=162.58 TRINITY_DN821_c0_g1_i1:254-1804(-)